MKQKTTSILDGQKISVSEILDIVDSASMGLWRIHYQNGRAPRMRVTGKMYELLGLDMNRTYTEEAIYEAWHSRICPEALESVNRSVEKMLCGQRDENTYKWHHPTRGIRYVRCGGIAHCTDEGSQIIEGYHYDVTEQILREMQQMRELKNNIEANRSKTMMLQNMTHEIRTPLNAMFGFSQLLSLPGDSFSDAEKTEFFNYIYHYCPVKVDK